MLAYNIAAFTVTVVGITLASVLSGATPVQTLAIGAAGVLGGIVQRDASIRDRS